MISKQEKLAKANLQRLVNKIKSDHSFGRIKTVGDYLSAIDWDKRNWRESELEKPITFKELKEKLDDLRVSIETEWWLKNNPPQISYDEEERLLLNGDGKQDLILQPDKHLILPTIDEKDKDYGLPPSDKELATLFWFQKKYAKNMLDGVLLKHLCGQLLIANAGYGKTFIIGAFLRRLIDANFHKTRTKSPWPYFYITKASVVEQTKRVLEKWFGIDTTDEVFVTNYDQLRATLGELYLRETTKIEAGIASVYWEWRKYIHPCVFIIDECHSAKNEQSQQSQIICSISRIESQEVYCIFLSASPGVRVADFKYFVVNCRIQDSVI